MQAIDRIVRGMGQLDGYGSHPGLPVFFAMSGIGFLVGWPAGIMNAALWGLLLCAGAYGRASSLDRSQASEAPTWSARAT
jgi:hypothetical protein